MMEARVVISPHNDATIPEARPGQVWVSPSPKISLRTIISVSRREITYHTAKNTERYCLFGTWGRWVRLSGARPS